MAAINDNETPAPIYDVVPDPRLSAFGDVFGDPTDHYSVELKNIQNSSKTEDRLSLNSLRLSDDEEEKIPPPKSPQKSHVSFLETETDVDSNPKVISESTTEHTPKRTLRSVKSDRTFSQQLLSKQKQLVVRPEPVESEERPEQPGKPKRKFLFGCFAFLKFLRKKKTSSKSAEEEKPSIRRESYIENALAPVSKSSKRNSSIIDSSQQASAQKLRIETGAKKELTSHQRPPASPKSPSSPSKQISQSRSSAMKKSIKSPTSPGRDRRKKTMSYVITIDDLEDEISKEEERIKSVKIEPSKSFSDPQTSVENLKRIQSLRRRRQSRRSTQRTSVMLAAVDNLSPFVNDNVSLKKSLLPILTRTKANPVKQRASLLAEKKVKRNSNRKSALFMEKSNSRYSMIIEQATAQIDQLQVAIENSTISVPEKRQGEIVNEQSIAKADKLFEEMESLKQEFEMLLE